MPFYVPQEGAEMAKAIVHVGSKNPDKIEATERAFSRLLNAGIYLTPEDAETFTEFEVIGFATNSEVRDQPLTLSEALIGAKNRAWRANREKANFSVGIEGGLHCIETGNNPIWFNCAIVCVYQRVVSYFGSNKEYQTIGHKVGYGQSNGVPIPFTLLRTIQRSGLELSFAVDKMLKTEGAKNNGGWHGVLTKAQIPLPQSIEDAILIALTSLEYAQVGSANYGYHAFK